MIGDFTLAHANRDKKDIVYGNIAHQNDTKAIKNVLTGYNGKVFNKIGEKSFITQYKNIDSIDFDYGNIVCYIGNNELIPIQIEDYNGINTRWKYGYEVNFNYDLLGEKYYDIINPNPIELYSVDTAFLYKVANALDTENFEIFNGEAEIILKALTHLYSFGSIVNGNIRIASLYNEYGNKIPNRTIHKNITFLKKDEKIKEAFYEFAKSNDENFALTPNDYSKLAVLDLSLTYLASGMPILIDKYKNSTYLNKLGYNVSYNMSDGKTLFSVNNLTKNKINFYERINECI